jgi:uncharacterized delta-60 repeat protein
MLRISRQSGAAGKVLRCLGFGAIIAVTISACSGANGSPAAAGGLDAGFSDGGKVSTDLGSPADRANAAAMQSDGKIVVAGSTQDPVQGDNFAIVRYAADGKLDTGFGDGGKVTTDFGGKSDIANAVTVQRDGKIVAVGTSQSTATGDDIALARYSTAGNLDTGFGDGGKITTDLGTPGDRANAVALQSDGEIVVAGTTQDAVQGDNFAVVRYNG